MSTVPPNSDDGALTLGELLRGAWTDRYWLLGIVIAALLLTALIVLLTSPVYRATAIVIPAESKQQTEGLGGLIGQLGGVASVVGIDLPAVGNHFESLALIESRGFIADFIERHKLMPILYPDRWDTEAQRWHSDEREPSLDEAARYFADHVLVVAEDKRTGVITISVEFHDRVLAATWANGLVQDLNAELRRRAGDEAQRAIAYLNEHMDQTSSVEMRQVLYKIMENQLRSQMLSNVQQEFALKVIDWARPPGQDEIARPQKLLLGIAGLLVGVFIGLAVTASRSLRRRRR
ncbi:MAG: Wzz/FepE/Etk N-terminal domain-containing protein [Gammaproteobacteria bacterium]|nr:MAG: Wzz/FepE/Etk N-terminal domain-containing protein [Gammaproteobacteria bacterium]